MKLLASNFEWWFAPYVVLLGALSTAYIWLPLVFLIQTVHRRKLTIRDTLVFTTLEAIAIFWALRTP
jgi:hypothetical protein